MRTSHLACIALLVTLSVAATSAASTYALAQAGSSVVYDYDEDSNQKDVTAWNAGTYDWSYSLTANVKVYIRGTNATGCGAYAYAGASVSGVMNDSIAAVQFVQEEFALYTDSDSASESGTWSVSGPTVLLHFEEFSSAEAVGGNTCQVYARGYTSVSGSINIQ